MSSRPTSLECISGQNRPRMMSSSALLPWQDKIPFDIFKFLLCHCLDRYLTSDFKAIFCDKFWITHCVFIERCNLVIQCNALCHTAILRRFVIKQTLVINVRKTLIRELGLIYKQLTPITHTPHTVYPRQTARRTHSGYIPGPASQVHVQ